VTALVVTVTGDRPAAEAVAELVAKAAAPPPARRATVVAAAAARRRVVERGFDMGVPFVLRGDARLAPLQHRPHP
jgi:hypothetical protein